MSEDYDIAEELNRKVLEAISSADFRMQKGEISKSEYTLTLDTINSIALGLYDRDVAEMVSKALVEHRPEPVVQRESFFSAEKGVNYVIEHVQGSCEVRTYRVSSEGVKLISHKNYDHEVEGQAMASSLFYKSKAFLAKEYLLLSEAAE